MPLFPRWTNTVSRLSGVLLLAIPAIAIAGLMITVRSTWGTKQNRQVIQPVEFDHRHHVGDEGIDCRYCHFTVEKSASAGIPPTSTCLNCHSQIWQKSPFLEPVRQALFSDRPIRWQRVHQLQDFVYFNHSIHIAKGVGCETCHGRIDRMPAVEKVQPLSMGWCLDCHRDPAPYRRPVSEVTNMAWTPPRDPAARAAMLAAERPVAPPIACSGCHR